ncbi:hypothetical protein HDZ31DRAFT_83962 [Schizophyllum fasciatum]
MTRPSTESGASERKEIKKYGKAAAREALARKLAKQAPGKVQPGGRTEAERDLTQQGAHTSRDAAMISAVEPSVSLPSAKRRLWENEVRGTPTVSLKRARLSSSLEATPPQGTWAENSTKLGLLPMWNQAQGLGESIDVVSSPSLAASQSKTVHSSSFASPPSTPSPLSAHPAPSLPIQHGIRIGDSQTSAGGAIVVAASEGPYLAPAPAQTRQQEETLQSACYDPDKAPDWRLSPLWTAATAQKAGILKQDAIRYFRLGTVDEFLYLQLGIILATSVLHSCAHIAPDHSKDRITFKILEKLLTRHGQRCEKSRLGLVLRFGSEDITPRLSFFSNTGEGFIHPPAVDVFVEQRFVAQMRERYESEDLHYMVTAHALSFPATYFDDIMFVRNAFTAIGDRLPRKAKSLARAALNAVVAGGRPFEFTAFKREIARLSKDTPLDESAELHERIRVIESFVVRPGCLPDTSVMFMRELTIVDMRDGGVCDEIKQALADLIVRNFVNAHPEKAGVPLFEDKVIVAENYDEFPFCTAVLSETFLRVMREKRYNRTTLLIDTADPICNTLGMRTDFDMTIIHRPSAISWVDSLLHPVIGHCSTDLYAKYFARLTPKEAMMCAPTTLLGKSKSPGIAFLGADIMKVTFL